jgi:hypothetical protein
MDSYGSKQDSGTEFSEHCNEKAGSVNGGNFVNDVKKYQDLKNS